MKRAKQASKRSDTIFEPNWEGLKGYLSGCRTCGVDTKKKCSRCHTAFYCSKECFGKGWKEHKKECQDNAEDNAPAEKSEGQEDKSKEE